PPLHIGPAPPRCYCVARSAVDLQEPPLLEVPRLPPSLLEPARGGPASPVPAGEPPSPAPDLRRHPQPLLPRHPARRSSAARPRLSYCRATIRGTHQSLSPLFSELNLFYDFNY